MAGPWEKYQKNVAQAAGPWQKFQQGAPASNEEVEQVMPEWMSAKDRAILKNFSNSPKASVKYLEGKYPGKLFKADESGNILAKSSPSEKWQTMDPDTGIFSRDILNDAADLAFDTAGGALQGAATTAGAAAALPSGPGALVAGMAASGASGAGIEAARQGIGQALGIPQDMDWKQVGTTGAIGAVTPGITGVGKVKGQNVQGLVGKGYDFVKGTMLPKIGEITSGIKADTIRHYANNTDVIDQLEREGITPYVDKVSGKVTGYLRKAKNEAGEEVASAINSAGKHVDVTEAQNLYLNAIDALENQTYRNEAEKASLQAVVDDFHKYFTKDGAWNVRQQSAKDAFSLQQSLKDSAAFHSNPVNKKETSRLVQETAQGGYHKLNDALDEATEGLSSQAKKRYADFKEIEEELLPKFDDAQKTFNTLSSLDSRGKKIMKERLANMAKTGELDLTEDIANIQAYNAFANPASMPVGFQGTTSTSRSVPLSIAGGSLGSLLGYKLGGGYAGAAVGGAIGAKAGAVLGSPQTIKGAIKTGKALEKAGKAAVTLGGRVDPRALSPYAAPVANQFVSPWFNMNQDEQY